MKMARAILIGWLLLAASGTVVHGAQNQEAAAKDVLSSAYANVKTAQELIAEANRALANSPRRQQIEFAINLYARAGEMFEKAAGIFESLGSDYASREDVEGARMATKNCLKTIEQLKQRLKEI